MVRSGSLRNPAGASSLATERVCSQGVGCRAQASWRASLLALGCTAAPRPVTGLYLKDCDGLLRVATQPSGSKLPRHGEGMQSRSGLSYAGLVASELARAGLHRSPKTSHRVVPERPQWFGQGRCATQREQAPSPRRGYAVKEWGAYGGLVTGLSSAIQWSFSIASGRFFCW